MTTDKARELTKEIESTVNALAEQTDAARKSETFLRWLTTMAQFHNYSWNNQLLIALQRPSATRVAGFHSWKKLGRNVKKGEKGIAILAPCLYRRTVEEENETITVKRLSGFRTVFVFDVEQTDGETLPSLVTSASEGGELLLPLLETATSKLNICLSYEEPSEAGLQGYSVGGRVVVRKSLSDAAKCAVLVHEVAHELVTPERQQTGSSEEVEGATRTGSRGYCLCRDASVRNPARCSVLSGQLRRERRAASKLFRNDQHHSENDFGNRRINIQRRDGKPR